MDAAARLELMRWLVEQALTGQPETDVIQGFCERCRDGGLDVSRGLMFIDTLHPIFEGRGFRWNDVPLDETPLFEYGSSEQGEAADNWQRSIFFHMLENGHDELKVDICDNAWDNFAWFEDLNRKGHRHMMAYVHRFGDSGTMGQMDCVYSYLTTRRPEGFTEQELLALRDLMPLLSLAIKSGAQVHLARTLGRVYLGRDAAEQVLRGRISRGVTEKITSVLWFSDLRNSTGLSEEIDPSEIIPFLNDYAGAAIDAVHDAGGDVLKLIGDGVLAVFTGSDITVAARAALRAEHLFRINMAAINVSRSARGQVVTSAHLGLHIGEVFYGNIGSEDRLDFTVVGPAVNEVSRIASMCRSIDRDLLASTAFQNGLDETGQRYLVSTGRYVLRGIDRAQDLYTLDPDVASHDDARARYEGYLAQ